MSDDRKEIILKFWQGLPRLRQQVSDSGLLDLCQQYLGELLGELESPPDQPADDA